MLKQIAVLDQFCHFRKTNFSNHERVLYYPDETLHNSHIVQIIFEKNLKAKTHHFDLILQKKIAQQKKQRR